jgi:hypothetical protein
MSNYPPGVTGNEYEIAGPDSEEQVGPCSECGAPSAVLSYRSRHWTECDNGHISEDGFNDDEERYGNN